MIKKIILGVLGLVLLCALGLFSFIQLNKSPQLFEPSVAGLYVAENPAVDSDSLKTIDSGRIVGFEDAYNTYAWLGIPYAAPPVKELRWKAPQAVTPWKTTLEATEYGSQCLQFWGVLAGQDGESGDLLGQEDCLTLNLWAPKSASSAGKPKPVMVWIHGGGNDSGTASLYQAHHLAGSKEVVVVTINYRLGLLGWFSHSAIRDTSDNLEDASGNYGTLDIIAALKWVKRNVSEFGGDPNNVTIFGESAGGRNVYSMLASPLAKGLFHRAISQSGSPDTTHQIMAEDFTDESQQQAVAGLKNSSNGLIALALGDQFPTETDQQIRDRIAQTPSAELIQIMREFNPKRLMQLASDNRGAVGFMSVARIIRDGHVIPKTSLLELFDSPDSYNNVPLMLGTNRDEQKVFMARNPEYVEQKFGFLPRIKNKKRYERVSRYISENWKAGAVDEPAKRIHAKGAPVYAYRFDWDEAPNNFLANLSELLGAAHGFEISFVFGDFTGGIPLSVILSKDNAPGRKELSLAMMDYWAEFAHNGEPARGASGQQNEWHAWSNSGHNIMLLDTTAGGGNRMQEIRTNVSDIKAQIPNDDVLTSSKDRCQAYATLFLHGYQASDFWSAEEYSQLGCEAYPVGSFREG